MVLYSILLQILNNQNSYSYIDDLLTKHKIFITPGTIFGSLGEGYVRISLCVSIAKIEEAINRIT